MQNKPANQPAAKRQDRVIAIDVDALPWIKPARPTDPPDPTIRYRTIFEGGEGLPQTHLSHYSPGHTEARHRHPEDEVLMLFEGELNIEGALHRAPSVLYISRGTLYGPLTAGPEGAKFFRVAWLKDMLFPAEASAA
ncbi:MAG: Cupin 2 conserved barrel domain protein [Caulobacter sp.]|nr:Cupin 2 conserved barrel domain protein [Caulobacter sp.]